MNFELAIRAEFVTQHLMHEQGVKPTLPLEMYVQIGYDLMLEDPKKWQKINQAYELDIKRCLKSGIGNRKAFKFRKLTTPTGARDE